jgi:putative transcriptional regulator
MISYKPFLKLLIDKDMKKQDLVNAGILSWTTMAKIDKSQRISLDVIEKICVALNCQPGDLVEYIPEKE